MTTPPPRPQKSPPRVTLPLPLPGLSLRAATSISRRWCATYLAVRDRPVSNMRVYIKVLAKGVALWQALHPALSSWSRRPETGEPYSAGGTMSTTVLVQPPLLVWPAAVPLPSAG